MASYEQTLLFFERWCREQLNIDDVDKVTESVIRRCVNDLQKRGKHAFLCSFFHFIASNNQMK